MSHEHPHPPVDASTDPAGTAPRPDDTAPLGWAVTQTMPYAGSAPLAEPATAGAEPDGAMGAPHTAPAVNPPTWTGRKTAIAAALAIGISSLGAVGAAAALPAGTMLGDTGGQVQRGGPGGQGGPGGPGGFGGPMQGQQQGQQGAVPGGQLPGGQAPGAQVPGPSSNGGQAPAAPGASTT